MQSAYSWPLGNPVKPGSIAATGSNRIVLGINYSALFGDPMMSAVLSQAYGNSSMGSFMSGMIAGMGWLTMAAGADASVASGTMVMNFDAESAYGKLFGSLKGGKPAFRDSLTTEEIFGMAANMGVGDPKAYGDYMRSLLNAFGMGDPDALIESYETLISSMAGDSSFSMDINPVGPIGDIDDIASLGFKVSGRARLRDAEAFRGVFGQALGSMGDFFNAVMAASIGATMQAYGQDGADASLFEGISLDITVDQVDGGDSGGYDRLGLTLNGLGEYEASQINGILDLFDTCMAYEIGRASCRERV